MFPHKWCLFACLLGKRALILSESTVFYFINHSVRFSDKVKENKRQKDINGSLKERLKYAETT
jgi:hypothetical protein